MKAPRKKLRLLFVAAVLVLFLTGISTAEETGAKVNINTATAKELTQLKGIGKTIAERIVTYREKVAPFTEPKEITKVKGVGKGTFEKIKDQITVGEKVAKTETKKE